MSQRNVKESDVNEHVSEKKKQCGYPMYSRRIALEWNGTPLSIVREQNFDIATSWNPVEVSDCASNKLEKMAVETTQ